MLAPPSQIIGGGLGPPCPPSSYAYDLNPKKKSVCVCVCGGGGGGGEGAVCVCGGGRCWKQNCFLGGGDQGQQLKEV